MIHFNICVSLLNLWQERAQYQKERRLVGGKFSNRTRATQFNPTGKVRKQLNMQKKKIYIPELKKSITINLSTRAIKTINKNGAYQTLKKAGLDINRPGRFFV